MSGKNLYFLLDFLVSRKKEINDMSTNILQVWIARLNHFIWEPRVESPTAWQQRGFGALRIAYLTIRDVVFENQLTLRAMSLVYTTLLSLVPLLAVSFSVLKGLGGDTQLELVLGNFLEPMGERGREITAKVIEFVENINAGWLGGVGLVIFFYTIISLMQKIESAFNYVWHVSEVRSFARRFSDYLSVILFGPVLIFAAMTLSSEITSNIIFKTLVQYEVFSFLFKLFTTFIPYLLLIVAFSIIYIFVPNTKVKLSAAITGAAVGALLWELVGWLFSSVLSFDKYVAIYAAFASLFLFVIWLYVSWIILLIGSTIAFYFQYPEYRMQQRRLQTLSNRMKEKLALAAMSEIASSYYHVQPNMTMHSLTEKLHISSDLLSPIINSLIKAQLLLRTDADPSEYIPGEAPEVMQLVDILRAVRESEEDEMMNAGRIPLTTNVASLFQNYQQAVIDAMNHKTLKDLVRPADTTRDNTKTT